MVSLDFAKYHGAGNDFILFDDRENRFPLDPELIRSLCHRRLGIGADGVILLQRSEVADFRMRIFNADGSEPTMCGNGVRCLVDFIRHLQLPYSQVRLETGHGIVSCRWQAGRVGVNLGMPRLLHQSLSLPEVPDPIHVVDTGVPHAILFVEETTQIDLAKLGPLIRFHKQFYPAGVNVTIASLSPFGELMIRTYERGVEAETLACGTGAAAAAWMAAELFDLPPSILIRTASCPSDQKPELEVHLLSKKGEKAEVELFGPATCVYEGQVVV